MKISSPCQGKLYFLVAVACFVVMFGQAQARSRSLFRTCRSIPCRDLADESLELTA